MPNTDQSRRLMWHGALLFLLGLITGLLVQTFANPRMGVSAHLEGVLNGILLIALGLLWDKLNLSGQMLNAAFWLALYGSYVNWGATLLAAIMGTRSLAPIAAGSHVGAPWQEFLITAALVTIVVAMLIVALLVLLGLGATRPRTTTLSD
jgi:hydroxylaminobenzene mutase